MTNWFSQQCRHNFGHTDCGYADVCGYMHVCLSAYIKRAKNGQKGICGSMWICRSMRLICAFMFYMRLSSAYEKISACPSLQDTKKERWKTLVLVILTVWGISNGKKLFCWIHFWNGAFKSPAQESKYTLFVLIMCSKYITNTCSKRILVQRKRHLLRAS